MIFKFNSQVIQWHQTPRALMMMDNNVIEVYKVAPPFFIDVRFNSMRIRFKTLPTEPLSKLMYAIAERIVSLKLSGIVFYLS